MVQQYFFNYVYVFLLHLKYLLHHEKIFKFRESEKEI